MGQWGAIHDWLQLALMAYGFVQVAHAATNTVTITSSGSTNLLVVDGSWSDSSNQTPTIDTNLGTNVGTICQAKTTDAFNFSGAKWYLKNIASGITSVTLTFAGGTPGQVDIWVSEYSGIDTSAPFIVSAGQAQLAAGTGTDAITSGNGNVTSQPALIHSVSNDALGGSGIAAGTGFTSRSTAAGVLEDKRVTATGNTAGTATASSGTPAIITVMAAFAEAATDTLMSQICI